MPTAQGFVSSKSWTPTSILKKEQNQWRREEIPVPLADHKNWFRNGPLAEPIFLELKNAACVRVGFRIPTTIRACPIQKPSLHYATRVDKNNPSIQQAKQVTFHCSIFFGSIPKIIVITRLDGVEKKREALIFNTLINALITSLKYFPTTLFDATIDATEKRTHDSKNHFNLQCCCLHFFPML